MEGVGGQAFPVTLVALFHVFSSQKWFWFKKITPNISTYSLWEVCLENSLFF